MNKEKQCPTYNKEYNTLVVLQILCLLPEVRPDELLEYSNFFNLLTKSYRVTIQMKPLWQNFCIGPFFS